jgi:hypothetical protein
MKKTKTDQIEKKKIEKVKIESNKTTIFEAFKKLGWSFIHRGCGFHYFVKPNKKELPLHIWFPQDEERPARVEYDFDDYNGCVCFDFQSKRVYFQWLDDDCISLVAGVKNNNVFINFSNHK